jgi:hypothetical protein
MENDQGFTEWGPYLSFGTDSSKEMRISWETDQFEHHCVLKYGLSPECDNKKEISWCEPTKHHTIILSDLKANTIYYYRIERYHYKPTGTNVSPLYTFMTGPEPVKGSMADNSDLKNNIFDFTVVGDIHAGSGSPVIGQGFEAMDRHISDRKFHVTLGDCINDGNREKDWQAFFQQLDPWLHTKPMMNATGNHDTDNEGKYSRFIKTWDHPYVNKQKGGYYTFRYGNTAFIMLDSNNAGGWEPTPLDDQYEWLESTLSEYYHENLWIIVCLHHQIYSTGDFSMPYLMNEIYRPLFDEYHVDMVFYGHDHHYEAYWTGRNTTWGGTKYFVAGAGGGQERVDYGIMGDRGGNTKYVWQKRTYSYEKDGILPAPKNATQHALNSRNDDIVREAQLFGVLEPNFVQVSITGSQCKLRCIGWQDQVFHEFSFVKTQKKAV